MVFKSIAQAKKALVSKEISVKELLESFIKNTEKNAYNEFITKTTDLAMEKATESQERINKGNAKILEGIPCAIKDLFCTKGVKTTAASQMLSNFIPPYESTVTDRIFNQGAIMIGKTNMDEFAMGSTNTTSYFGRCYNPYVDIASGKNILHPGGSSGGSAVSVASGSSLFATASDTGGSTRQPAALCGVVGYKPTYGICSRYGMIAFSSSFDQAGFITNTVEDVATVLSCVAGEDANDSTTAPNSAYSINAFLDQLNNGVKGMRIAIISDDDLSKINPEISQAVVNAAMILEEQGAIVTRNVTIENVDKCINVYYIITPAECFSNLARYDGIRFGTSIDALECKNLDDFYNQNRGTGFGEEVKRRIAIGSFILSDENYQEYFIKAQEVRSVITHTFNSLFEKFDAIIMPTTADVAKDPNITLDPVEIYMNDQFVVPANCAGLPSISIPFGSTTKSKLPIGIQILSNRFHDAKILQIAQVLESNIKH